MEAGVSGIKLTSAQVGTRTPEAAALQGSDEALYSVPHPIYLIHSAKRDASLDKDDLEYYRIRIWLDADTPEILGRVESVTYHLHPSFTNSARIVSAPEGGFALATAAWGQFAVHASLKIRNEAVPLELERYLDF